MSRYISLSKLLLCFSLTSLGYAFAGDTVPAAKPPTTSSLPAHCSEQLAKLVGPYEKAQLDPVCAQVKVMEGCQSKAGTPIFHYDKIGTNGDKSKRVLALALIHGDEGPSGSVARAWMTRLQTIDPRNSWRVIPIVNPDGLKLKTRTNGAGVDLNRNFPSKDWNEKALQYWKVDRNSDPRRYPGPSGSSEIETACLIKHLDEFKPDFVISIHTPLGVLDFDGPRVGNPNFRPLPWVSLGNYPGSLGRYMWVDRKVPVLTIELRGNTGLKKLEEFDRLQDVTGTVAIQADKLIKKDQDAAAKTSPAKKEAASKTEEGKPSSSTDKDAVSHVAKEGNN